MLTIGGSGTRVQIDLNPLNELIKELSGNTTTFKALTDKWAERYRRFLFKRFNTNGNGEWPPLKPSTRRRVSRGRTRLLRDSGALRAVLKPVKGVATAPGSLHKRIRGGVRLGYGGSARHPIATHLTIQRLAMIHSLGLGRVPVRKIVVPPDQEVISLMERDTRIAINRLKKRKGMK